MKEFYNLLNYQRPGDQIAQAAETGRLYYWRRGVKFRLIRYMQNREFAMLLPKWYTGQGKALRFRRCHNVQGFDFLRAYVGMDWKHKPYNLYISNARFKEGMPHSKVTQTTLEAIGWGQSYEDFISAVDFFLDIDAKSHDQIEYAHETLLMVMALLERLDVPFSVVFSGMGFHVVIPYEYFSHLNMSFHSDDENNIYGLFLSIAKKLYENFSELIDLAVYDSLRLRKLPNSVVHYREKKGETYSEKKYVAHQFTEKNDILSFCLEDYEFDNYYCRIYPRDPYVFNRTGNVEKLLLWLRE